MPKRGASVKSGRVSNFVHVVLSPAASNDIRLFTTYIKNNNKPIKESCRKKELTH